MIKNIEIEKYKCFENFKLENLSKINIISGENNVGKTALLECLLIEHDDFHIALSIIAKNRGIKKEYFQTYLNDVNYSFKNDVMQHKYKVKNQYALTDEEKKEKKKLNADYEKFQCQYYGDNLNCIPLDKAQMIDDTDYTYINSSKPSNNKLIKVYSKIQTLNLQHKFLTYLQLLDSNIQWIEPQLVNDELVLRVNLANPEIALITSELGEGVNRYIEILASMLSVKDEGLGKSIFIDEIENGIHYSKLFEIAKAIIEISQKENIQVFITTHDKDTIEAFAKASKEMSFKDISSIELYKDEQNKIVHISRNYEQFIATVDTGMEVR